MAETKTVVGVLVSPQWLESLTQLAQDFEEAQKTWESGNVKHDKIHQKAVMLMGYAKSAKYILEKNERLEVKIS